MPNRGSVNRRTGKTTPRRKVRTHWGASGLRGRAPSPAKSAKSGASSPAKSR